jgi:hypothetical protein
MASDIERVREIILDFYDSNAVRNENLSAQVGNNNLKFYISEGFQRVGKAVWNTTQSDSGSSFVPPFVVSFDTSLNISPTSYDTTLGWFTINSSVTSTVNSGVTSFPPPTGPVNTCYVDYFFQRFSDTDINNYLIEALGFLGGIYQTIDQAISEHQTAAIHYAAAKCMYGQAARAAELADQTLGQASAKLDGLSKKWKDIGKDLMDHAIYLRDDYYRRYGQRNAPAIAVARQNRDVRTWTPQR